MTIETNKKVTTENDEVDIGRIFGELLDHRKIIIAITSVFTVLVVVYVLLAAPIYQSNALIQVEQRQGNAILSNLTQMLPDAQPQSAPELALLQSRMILGKTVDDLNLQAEVKRKFFPIFGSGIARFLGHKAGEIDVENLYLPGGDDDNPPEILLTVLNKDSYLIEWNDSSYRGEVGKALDDGGISLKINKIDANVGDKFVITYLSRLKAISNLQESFSVTDQGKDTGMLNLTLTGDNPIMISKILDNISQNYLAQNVARQAAQDAKSLDFLNQQLPKVRTELDLAEDKLNSYRRQKDSIDLSMEAKSVLDQIVNVDNQLNELTFREAEVSQLYTKEHPTYKALIEKQATLKADKLKLDKKVSSMPKTQQEVLRLSRDVESGRAVYLQLLNRQQELNIAKSSAIGNVRIIDSAVTEHKPIKPKKILYILAGLLSGLVLSVGLVFLKVFLRRGIESPEQLEEFGINVYASVPVSEWLTNQNAKKKTGKNESEKLLAIDNPADLALESIRSLRTSLHFAMMEAKNNILMISGASPGVGKTFISTNLAATIAMTGKKVLFVDADLRKGYVHKLFGHQNTHGLSDILSGKIEINQAVAKLSGGDFYYINRGQVPPNPAELLMHPRFEALLKWASSNYDLVILDTPPILAVTDAAIIGQYVGTTLLVARFEINTAKEVAISVKRFNQSNVHIKGCILNGVMKKASNYYGYGYNHYGYSYTDKKNN